MSYAMFNALQSCVQELAEKRNSLESLDGKVFPCGGPRPKSLIEISGPSTSGKSLLLWRLMARCLLPTYFNGKNSDVILLDLSHKFSTDYLIEQIKRVVWESGEKCTAAELEFEVESCLSSVIVLRCYSPSEFDYALESLESILWERGNVALLAIDSLDEFYWLDVNLEKIRMETHYARNIARIREICEKHNLVCAFTIDSSYLLTKQGTQLSSKVRVDYQLQLDMSKKNGSCVRWLNGAAFFIDDSGINFKNEEKR